LNGVLKTALLMTIGDIARNTTRTKIAFQISLSIARLMTYSRSGTTELTSKLFETANKPNRKKSPRKIPRLFEKGKYRAAEKFCNARKRSSARFLRSIYVRKSIIID
jgi:hypothetical protein